MSLNGIILPPSGHSWVHAVETKQLTSALEIASNSCTCANLTTNFSSSKW